MEVAILSSSSLKIRGKSCAFIIDPDASIAKSTADAVIVTHKSDPGGVKKIEGSRVVIQGPGDYEVSGTKISGYGVNGHTVYSFEIDGIHILLSQSGMLEKLKDTGRDYSVLILKATGKVEEATISALEPKLVLFYGEQAKESAGTFSKEAESAQKVSVTADKLPEEMKVMVLG